MNPVFVDTVAFLALWNRSDQWHVPAKNVYAQLLRERVPIVTTTFILLECGNAASRRSFRNRVGAVRKSLASEEQLIAPTDSDCEAAWIAYDLGEMGDAGIVDHVSFEVMRRYSLTRAFTNDVHFQLAGFETLF